MATNKQSVAGLGIALGAVGGLFTLTIIGAVIGIPMVFVGVVLLLLVPFVDNDDEDPDADPDASESTA